MPRPTGVTAIAILLFVAAALYGLSGAAVALGGLDLDQLPPEISELKIPPEILARAMVLAMFIIAFGAAGLGLGLWYAVNWVRITTIILGSILIFFGGLDVVTYAVRAQDLALFLGFVKLAVVISVVWYLVQPRVKQAFLPAPPAPEPPSPPGGTPPPPDPPARP